MAPAQTQGDLSLLRDPVAGWLLRARIPARLAYSGKDGTPRVVPMWFHWNGETFVMGSVPNSPKVAALGARADVALTIDTDVFPHHVLHGAREGANRISRWGGERVRGFRPALRR